MTFTYPSVTALLQCCCTIYTPKNCIPSKPSSLTLLLLFAIVSWPFPPAFCPFALHHHLHTCTSEPSTDHLARMASAEHIEYAVPSGSVSVACLRTMSFGLVPHSESVAELRLLKKNQPGWLRRQCRRALAFFNRVIYKEEATDELWRLELDRARAQMVQVINNNITIMHYTDPNNSF
ncbi:hypothetical protein BD289DRAFT_173636 [Coniella lustricola]|uniref:Uncharacterized protein n=1 Tax=Coniella lustricola TaxID=2025994 RepID=A0A2T2ZTP8_9PEZI|nr:hypothetical protein BD289DRAFT_173636 [Coniella lustricola]